MLSKITNNLIKIKILELKGWGGTGQSSDRQLDYLNLPNFLRGASELKNVTKSGKFHHFLDPPLPQDVLDFFEFGLESKFLGLKKIFRNIFMPLLKLY